MKKFNYKSLTEVVNDFSDFALQSPEDLSILGEELVIGTKKVSNRFVIQPMEGVDANLDGTPSELTLRRYERFARGGAGLIWVEAVAVVPEGRTSKNQLWLTKENVGAFKALVDKMRLWAKDSMGDDFQHTIIIQLTHSGRFSKPNNVSAPIITYHNPYLNQKMPIDPTYPVVTDEYLEQLEDEYVEKALLAYEAGFDGVDIKCTHRYLISELTSAYLREGKYGGTFENRTRFLTNVVKKIRAKLGDKLLLTVRLNIYDGIPYPYGFGVDKEDYRKIDYTEPLKLIGILRDLGVKVINVSMGSPYYYPHVNRPFDVGNYTPDEDPIDGVKRLLRGAEVVQKTFPDLIVVGTGFSWLRQYSANIAAGLIRNGSISMAGIGRMAFAYPDMPKDIVLNKTFNPRKTCITCSKCSDLKSIAVITGCVVRDTDIYVPPYLEHFRKGK